MKGADYYEGLMREAINQLMDKSQLWYDFLMADGRMPGTSEMSEEDEVLYLQRIAPYLPEIAQKDPKRAAELMRRIDALVKENV